MKARSLGFAVALVVIVSGASAYGAAPAGRYTTSTLTVFDNKTGLTWQRTPPTTTFSWADAKAFCAGVGPTLGGTGWRLPTIKELQTILDYSAASAPLIDTTAFPQTAANWFWTASPTVDPLQASQAYVVSFAIGILGHGAVATLYNARCVR